MALNRNLLTTIATHVATQLELPFASLLPMGEVRKMVFLIGCGRSGTTIFGECLARHKEVTYLHEPRLLWAHSFPKTDIWTRQAWTRGGQLVLTDEDSDPAKSARLRGLFGFQVWKTGRPVLVEKLPINSFRIPLLASLFPDAKFIHLLRDGREVARSIQARADNPRNGWYGYKNYKWKQIAQLAEQRGISSDADALCTNNYERGLLEWRLSMELFKFHAEQAPSLLEISYNKLVELPLPVLESVLSFVGLESCESMSQYVSQHIQRRTPRIDNTDFTDKELAICGDMLEKVRNQLAKMDAPPHGAASTRHNGVTTNGSNGERGA